MAVPSTDMPLYISSGTWSLFGVETPIEITTERARTSGFTNEGGYNKSVRFLKNIMGLWMIQCVKKEYNDKYSFVDFADLASQVKDFNSIVDVNDISFFAPTSMIDAIKDYCKKTNQKVPNTVGEVALCVYASLAHSYDLSVKQIQDIYNMEFNAINIVGGGCQNVLLNNLTAKYSGKKVIAGPVEATALGNIAVQLMALGEIKDVKEARQIIANSEKTYEYFPQDKEKWDAAYEKFKTILK
jgi:rhamnulokinase